MTNPFLTKKENLTPNGKTVFGIDDGTREITLVNNYGRVICRLHFRTNEYAILDRYNELKANLPAIIEPLTQVDLNPNGTPLNQDEQWAILKKVEKRVKREINRLLDMDEADEIFKTHFPFSSVGGEYFLTKVLDAIGSAINASIAEEAALSQARMEKYMDNLDADNSGVSPNVGETADNA